MTNELFLTIKETQTRLRLGRTKIYALIGAGELQAVRIGRARRITVSSIHQFANKLTTTVSP